MKKINLNKSYNLKQCFVLSRTIQILILLIFSNINLLSQKNLKGPLPLSYEKGKLIYSSDSLGNRILDFSYCGYKASEQAIPTVSAKIIVPNIKGDATKKIQAAINYVAHLPLNENGFRGAIILQKGIYEVYGQLTINATGIVLRGSGAKENGTTIIGAGTTRETLINIIGKKITIEKEEIKIADAYVPVNAFSFSIAQVGADANQNNHIIIHRPSPQNWIQTLGAETFGGGLSSLGWKPGDRDLFFDRTITKREGNKIFIDAPITTALDSNFGEATLSFYNNENRINNCGVENISLISTFNKNNLKDEDHRWNAINIENAEDCWVRQISFQNFAGSAISVLETSKKITIEDCISTNPISEIGGQRRFTFLTTGQQTLFQRCYAENGYHDFATGYCAAGPNAFVQCEATNANNFSGGIDSWGSGILMDIVNIDGNALRFGNRGQDGNGAGWSAANSVFWNCTAARIDCYKPPTAQNYSFGSWAQFSGDGYWTASNDAVNPRSLYYTQLAERLNKDVRKIAQILPLSTDASSSPSIEVAQQLTKEALNSKLLLIDWIKNAEARNPILSEIKNVKTIDEIGIQKNISITPTPTFILKNGWVVRNNEIVVGKRNMVPWWNGGVQGNDLVHAKPHITRFVPGRVGNGLTDNLEEETQEMKANNIIALEHNYGLWYDLRRDDHERIRRMDGDVWPPFYELPFARTGIGSAWDGLSKYDLTKYNLFYWSRLKQFADLADEKGLILIHQNYFQHNIIEAGAHYVDFPWRTANNINNTGFVEPVNFAGDKRIFYAEQFYDLNNPIRKEIHRKYIHQCLNNFKDNNSVIQTIGEEFTGPLHFVKFWLDEIKDWEKETGKKQMIALSTTKDVQDSILQNDKYANIVDIIDIRYWHYQADGTTYEPKGGQSLAPRQHARLLKPKKTSFEQVYRAVKAYKEKYPTKAVMYSADSYPEFGVASFMAGGSLAQLPASFTKQILQAAIGMKPIESLNKNEYILGDGKQSIIYNSIAKTIIIK